jgi:hypothetical protein
MIVVEGADGSGKTTLAEWICEETGREYRRPSQEVLSSTEGPTPALLEWWNEQLWLEQVQLKDGVYDRCTMISEPIYMPVTRPKPLYQPSEHERLMRRFIEVQPLIIFCNPPWSAIKENFKKHKLKGVTLAQQAQIVWLYHQAQFYWEEIFENRPNLGRVLSYDWQNTDELWPGIYKYIEEEASLLSLQQRGGY